MLKNKTIFISGGSGSWGQELTKQLLKQNPKEIRIYSRGELAQVEMKRRFNNHEKLKLIIGDVRSLNRLNMSMKGVDVVFHLAALKHVPICEENTWESVNTNIIGVENIIRAAKTNKVKKVIDVSTDKACNPFNMYGACKSVGEKLIINANKNSTTKFVCVRAGNVIGSNGSVIPFFIDKAKKGKPLPITDYRMTRYLMTLPDAIELVLRATIDSYGGEIFVTKMSAANILTLAEVIKSFYDKDYQSMSANEIFPEIGIRSGEKIDEMLVSEHEALYTVEDKNFRIILPMDKSLDEKYEEYPVMSDKSYTSNDKLLDPVGILKLLEESGFLK